MKTVNLITLSALAAIANCAPLALREVPQEHSHEQFLSTVRTSLALNNPDGIVDPVFGLLGNAAAKAGLGKISDPDCLQQATADQAFSNAKAAGDVAGMTAAIIYRAVERNTGKVGLQSVLCTAIKAVNPEIAAITQHQDPASAGAAASNKAITLEAAKQIAAIGGNPQDALKSGTFAPGNLNDNTGKGDTCDVANDPVGCIFTQNLLVEDATAAEIDAAVAGVAAAAPAAAAPVAVANPAAACPPVAADAAVPANASAAAPAVAAPVAVTPPTAAAVAPGGLDLGTCAGKDFTITFAAGINGRKETAFKPTDSVSFPQGEAQNANIITNAMCDFLRNRCAASGSFAQCQTIKAQVAALASTQKPQNGGLADLWNSLAAGKTTNFVKVVPVDNQGKEVPIVGGVAAAAPAAPVSAPAPALNVPAAAPVAAPVVASGNVQTFSGALGGIAAPAVNVGGRGFIVGQSDFINKGAAIQRSCAQQNNACANAANASKTAGFSVGDCGAQEKACNAA